MLIVRKAAAMSPCSASFTYGGLSYRRPRKPPLRLEACVWSSWGTDISQHAHFPAKTILRRIFHAAGWDISPPDLHIAMF